MIEKNNLIKRISKSAKINLTQAKAAYETVLKESPAFRKQSVKTVQAKKEVAVKTKGKATIKKVQLKKEVPVKTTKTIEKIKKVEVIKEVPVEVVKEIEIIKEIEVIKEVPVIVEKEVIKEVKLVVEKPVEVIKEITLVQEVEVVKEVEKIRTVRDLKEAKKWEKMYNTLLKKYEKLEGQIDGYKTKLAAKPKEVIKEIEVIKEVPVEIIKEVEVVKSIDMASLQKMMAKLGTVEVSKQVVGETRTRQEGKIVERREVKPRAKAAKTKKDDLKKIEGIGPKIEKLLHADGIKTFDQLAKAKTKRVADILEAAGPRFRMHDPGSWAKQAKLAADGKWDQLKKLQDELDGGR